MPVAERDISQFIIQIQFHLLYTILLIKQVTKLMPILAGHIMVVLVLTPLVVLLLLVIKVGIAMSELLLDLKLVPVIMYVIP